MPTPCTICHHPDAEDIDTDVRDGVSGRRIAAARELSPSALSRHIRNGHVSWPAEPVEAVTGPRTRLESLDGIIHSLTPKINAMLRGDSRIDIASVREYRLALMEAAAIDRADDGPRSVAMTDVEGLTALLAAVRDTLLSEPSWAHIWGEIDRGATERVGEPWLAMRETLPVAS